jgi:ribosomal protein S6
MQSNTHDEKMKVYEIGFVLVPSIPQEKVAGEFEALKNIAAKAGAEMIAEEAPEMRALAYTMVKKIHGANVRFNEGYFGWIKFELAASAIDSVKKSLDAVENILRYLLITTVRENTYLGKKAPAVAFGEKDAGIIAPEGAIAAAGVVTPATTEEIDKGIDAMVSPGVLVA